MAKLDVIDLTGAKLGEIEVADDVFAVEVKEHLLWEVVRAQRAAKRRGTAKAKDRSEVNVTKDKVYKQKGTGNARHGSRRANVYRGGGVVHGPRPRDYSMSVNKKVMAGALRSALTVRARAGDLIVVRELSGEAPKTKLLATALVKLHASRALLVDSDNAWLQTTARNLADADFLDVRGLNVYDILDHPKLVMSEASLRTVEARLTRSDEQSAADAASEAGG